MVAQLLHVLSEVNEEERTGLCSHCAGRTRLMKRNGHWHCTRRLFKIVNRSETNGRVLEHQLQHIDVTTKTATCAVCGPVRIYAAKGARARRGQTWVCGRRPAQRGVGGLTSAHQLSNIDEKLKRATCSTCGPTEIVWRDFQRGGGRWGCTIKRHTMGRSAYKWSEDYKRAICPFCTHWHRWDRDKGRVCRDRLVQQAGNACAICAEQFTKKSTPRIDHNHTTGAVRGVLCRNCNVALGLLKDDPACVKKAFDYLSR